MLKTYLAVMIGGALGSGLRMALSTWLAVKYGEAFPVGTLVVNVTGCLVMGFFASLTGPAGAVEVAPTVRPFVMIGILGGYTTFSSYSLQTLSLVQQGAWPRAVLYTVLSVLLCLLAVWAGHVLAVCFGRR